MHYEDQKWGLDKEPPFVVREWKAQSWASSAASSGTAMETFTKSLKFATGKFIVFTCIQWYC